MEDLMCGQDRPLVMRNNNSSQCGGSTPTEPHPPLHLPPAAVSKHLLYKTNHGTNKQREETKK